jgi:hypothetical protein
MRIDMVLRRLEEEQTQFAKEALQQPQGHDAFDYGRAVGLYAGLERAKDILISIVADQDRKDYDL